MLKLPSNTLYIVKEQFTGYSMPYVDLLMSVKQHLHLIHSKLVQNEGGKIAWNNVNVEMKGEAKKLLLHLPSTRP
jgi:hypothetical protein